jgi:hypothetical protein
MHLRSLNASHPAMVRSKGLKIYGIEITRKNRATLLNSMNIYRLAQKLSVRDLHVDREHSDIISIN